MSTKGRTDIHSQEYKDRLSKEFKGKANPQFKGKKAGYSALHEFIRFNYGKATHCENPGCIYPRKNPYGRKYSKPSRYDWALKIGRTYSRERSDYFMLCVSCHRQYDHGKLEIAENLQAELDAENYEANK